MSWSVESGCDCEDEALAGVATACDGAKAVEGRNCNTIRYDFSVYVETAVTWCVGCWAGNYCSAGRMSHAISEFRVTRVTVTAYVWSV